MQRRDAGAHAYDCYATVVGSISTWEKLQFINILHFFALVPRQKRSVEFRYSTQCLEYSAESETMQ